MLSTMTASEAAARKAWPSRYEQLQRLEDASQPPTAPPASDPHPGVSVFNYTGVAAVVEMLIAMTNGERQTVARELAEHDWEMADAFAAMILDAGYDCKKVWGIEERVGRAEVTLVDYVAGMVD